MNSTRYVLKNHVTTTGSLKTPLPATDPAYPAANLLDPDRDIVAAVLPTGADLSIFFDIGAGKTTDIIGLVGHTIIGAALPNDCIFSAGNTYPKDGTWVAIGTVPIGVPPLGPGTIDVGLELASPVTYRYWETLFSFNFNGFILSRPLIGQKADLGIGYSRGTAEDLQLARIREPGTWGRSSRVANTGQPASMLDMLFLQVPDSIRTALRSLALTSPFLLVHPILGLMEVDLADDRIHIVHQFGPPNLWDIEVSLEQLV